MSFLLMPKLPELRLVIRYCVRTISDVSLYNVDCSVIVYRSTTFHLYSLRQFSVIRSFK